MSHLKIHFCFIFNLVSLFLSMPRRTHITHINVSQMCFMNFYIYSLLYLHTDPQSRKWMNINTHCIQIAIMGLVTLITLILLLLQLLLLYCVKNETVANSIKVTNWFFNELFLIVIVQLHFYFFIYLFFASTKKQHILLSCSRYSLKFHSVLFILFFSYIYFI